MVSKKKDAGKGDDKKTPKKGTTKKNTTTKRRRPTSVVNHSITSRWIQEQLLDEIPQLGYVPESLIELILKMSHKYYVQQGFSSIKLSDK